MNECIRACVSVYVWAVWQMAWSVSVLQNVSPAGISECVCVVIYIQHIINTETKLFFLCVCSYFYFFHFIVNDKMKSHYTCKLNPVVCLHHVFSMCQ